jgi:hypothetical protein
LTKRTVATELTHPVDAALDLPSLPQAAKRAKKKKKKEKRKNPAPQPSLPLAVERVVERSNDRVS